MKYGAQTNGGMTSIDRKHFAKQVIINCKDCEIKGHSILKNCPEECLAEISDSKRALFFAKGQRIMLEGNLQNGIYFVKSGKVKIYRSDAKGAEQVLRFAKSGDLLGFSIGNGEKDRTVSAMAISDVMVCHLRNETFLGIIKKYPKLTFELLSLLSSELEKADERFVKLALLPVKARVVDALLSIYEVEGSNDTIQLSLSRQEMANLACTTKEQVSKILSDLQTQKLITTKGKRIDLLNIKALRELVA